MSSISKKSKMSNRGIEKINGILHEDKTMQMTPAIVAVTNQINMFIRFIYKIKDL